MGLRLRSAGLPAQMANRLLVGLAQYFFPPLKPKLAQPAFSFLLRYSLQASFLSVCLQRDRPLISVPLAPRTRLAARRLLPVTLIQTAGRLLCSAPWMTAGESLHGLVKLATCMRALIHMSNIHKWVNLICNEYSIADLWLFCERTQMSNVKKEWCIYYLS